MKTLREIFDDHLTKAAGIVFLLTVALVTFNSFSDFNLAHPLIGVFLYAMVPVLFVVGGIIFIFAIMRS